MFGNVMVERSVERLEELHADILAAALKVEMAFDDVVSRFIGEEGTLRDDPQPDDVSLLRIKISMCRKDASEMYALWDEYYTLRNKLAIMLETLGATTVGDEPISGKLEYVSKLEKRVKACARTDGVRFDHCKMLDRIQAEVDRVAPEPTEPVTPVEPAEPVEGVKPQYPAW